MLDVICDVCNILTEMEVYMKWKCKHNQTKVVKILSESEAFNLDKRLWMLSEAKEGDCDSAGFQYPSRPNSNGYESTGKM